MGGRILWLSLAAVVAAFAQKYDGPRPPKPDIPYLKEADNLIPTEAVMAKAEKKGEETTFVIDGAASSARTPLPFPVFLMQAGKLQPGKLLLYRLEVRDGRREIVFPARKPPEAIRMVATKLSADGIWKIEVDDTLDRGEYVLTFEGSNQVFCFEEF